LFCFLPADAVLANIIDYLFVTNQQKKQEKKINAWLANIYFEKTTSVLCNILIASFE